MAVTITLYPDFKVELLNGDTDLDGDTIKLALLDNDAVYNAAHTVFSDLSAEEIAAANGYSAGGATLANKAVSAVSTNAKFDADDVSITPSGGSISAYKGVLYSTTNGDRLIAFIDFDGQQTAGDGTLFLVRWHANGIIVLS